MGMNLWSRAVCEEMNYIWTPSNPVKYLLYVPTLVELEVSISDKISPHKVRLYFLMRNDPNFHVGYAPKIESGASSYIKFQKKLNFHKKNYFWKFFRNHFLEIHLYVHVFWPNSGNKILIFFQIFDNFFLKISSIKFWSEMLTSTSVILSSPNLLFAFGKPSNLNKPMTWLVANWKMSKKKLKLFFYLTNCKSLWQMTSLFFVQIVTHLYTVRAIGTRTGFS